MLARQRATNLAGEEIRPRQCGGGRVRFRALSAEDKQRVRDHVRNLSADQRRSAGARLRAHLSRGVGWAEAVQRSKP